MAHTGSRWPQWCSFAHWSAWGCFQPCWSNPVGDPRFGSARSRCGATISPYLSIGLDYILNGEPWSPTHYHLVVERILIRCGLSIVTFSRVLTYW